MANKTSQKTSVEAKVQNVQNENQNFYNIWNKTYKALVQGYVDAGEVNEFDCVVRRMDDTTYEGQLYEGSRKVFGYLRKATGLEIESVTEFYKDGKRYYQVKVKNFNIRAEVDGKFGKRKLFSKQYGEIKLS